MNGTYEEHRRDRVLLHRGTQLSSSACLTLGLIGATMMLGTSVYQAVVDVPNWTANLPQTAIDFRACMRYSDPTRFYQAIGPATIIGLLIATTLSWRSTWKWWAVASVAVLIATELITVLVVYPINDRIFRSSIEAARADGLMAAATQWQSWHALRIALLVLAVLLTARAYVLASRGVK